MPEQPQQPHPHQSTDSQVGGAVANILFDAYNEQKRKRFTFDTVDPDAQLRPKRLSEIIGQEHIKKSLARFIAAAKIRGEVLDHTLFCGPAGLGKTTFANVIWTEMNHMPVVFTGPNLDLDHLAALVSNIINASSKGLSVIVFIDEIHAVPKESRELLLTLMEDFLFEDLQMPPFTLIGGTTDPDMLSAPLRRRFLIDYTISYYRPEEIQQIVTRSLRVLMHRSERNLTELVEDGKPGAEAVRLITNRAKGIPSTANRLVKRTLDYMIDTEHGSLLDDSGDVVVRYDDMSLNPDVVREAMHDMGIDIAGLDRRDRSVLVAMNTRYHGRPVGLEAICSVTGEKKAVMEKVVEPDLVRMGYINRERSGRVLTQKGIKAAILEEEGETKY